jgi:hypothetical protein
MKEEKSGSKGQSEFDLKYHINEDFWTDCVLKLSMPNGRLE